MNVKEKFELEIEELQQEKEIQEETLSIYKREKKYYRDVLISGYFLFSLICYFPMFFFILKQQKFGIPLDLSASIVLFSTASIETAIYLFSTKVLNRVFMSSYEFYSEFCDFTKEYCDDLSESIEVITEEIENVEELESAIAEKEPGKENPIYSQEEIAFAKRYYNGIFVPLLKGGVFLEQVFEQMSVYTEKELEIIERMFSMNLIPDFLIFVNYGLEEPFSLLSEEVKENMSEEEKNIFCYNQCKQFIEKLNNIQIQEEQHVKTLER